VWLKWVARAVAAAAVIAAALFLLSTFIHLKVPEPTGSLAVGKTQLDWIDASRHEWMTSRRDDKREVVAVIWYPAEGGTGQAPAYVRDLGDLAPGMVASTKLSRLEAWGLRLVRDGARWGATCAKAEAPYPVIILSPGNGGNVEFYAAYAEDLASRGYVVVGLDHPFDVAAVRLSDGTIASFDPGQWPTDNPERREFLIRRMDERAADVSFALDCLQQVNTDSGPLAGALDLQRIGVMGHSMGGITGAAASRLDARLKACLNIDGSLAGGPFSARPGDECPGQPFLYVTKDEHLPETYAARFARSGGASFRVVIPRTTHVEFADGPLFVPSFDPFARHADRVIATTRAYAAAFFDRYVKGTGEEDIEQLTVPLETQAQVFSR
jgi:dienelactone hydrolase